ncbi:hypothetical protein CW705_00320 [Candidatus Bathyarchaeota archaeon]|nr:MAG: hypothetical protein CW705_00320 [Candidatus Bathyarchaeota archaeon]
MSISEKLTDYDQTIDLLRRLNKEELIELAERNGIKLEWEDISGKVHQARTKSQIIDLLLESEFRESDLIELLGISRLTKEELLNCMNISQLKQLAKETGIELVKSSIFGTKKAVKKKDIINVLEILSTSKIREFAEKISLIKPSARMKLKAKRRKPRSKKAKARIQSKRQKGKVAKPAIFKKKILKPTKPSEVKFPLVKKEISVSPRLPTGRAALKRGGIIEEIINEKVTERRIVRRMVLLEVSEKEIAETLERFSPKAAKRERGYKEQLSELFKEKGLLPDEKTKKREGFDFVFGKNRIAVKLKAIGSQKAVKELVDKISKHLDQYDKIFAVVIDETRNPEKTRKKIEEIEKLKPGKISVILKKTRKKRS